MINVLSITYTIYYIHNQAALNEISSIHMSVIYYDQEEIY